MSNNVNDDLLERAESAIDEAAQHAEYWTSTTAGKVVDELVAQVTKHIDTNNLDDLFMMSLPALVRMNKQLSALEAEQSQDHFKNYDIYMDIYNA